MRLFQELSKLLAREEPVVASITRKQDRVMVEARTGDLKPIVPGLVDLFLFQMVKLRTVGPSERFERPKAIEQPAKQSR
jgi:hypothetical protein